MYHCLQSRATVSEMAHSVSSDACQTTSGQDVTVNVEELEVGVGEGTERISFPEIKAES